jgi:hypothetical protein
MRRWINEALRLSVALAETAKRVTVWSGVTITVLHNPTQQVFEYFAANHNNNLRGLLSYDGKNVYLWAAYAAVHPNIIQELGLEHVSCIAYRHGRWHGPDLFDDNTGHYVEAIERLTPYQRGKNEISDDELLRMLHDDS